MSMPRWLLLLRCFLEPRANFPVHAVLMVGVALSVMVLVWILSLRQGFISTFAASGRTDQALVLSNPATSEIASFIRIDAGLALAQHSLVARTARGLPIASPEIFTVGYLATQGSAPVSVSLRGLAPFGATLRDRLRLTAGRMFSPGRRELIVGKGVLQRVPGLRVGQHITVRGIVWEIVGMFESGDAAHSELWGDLHSVQNALGQRGFQSIRLRFYHDADRERFAADVRRDAGLNATVMSERDYYSKNSIAFPRAAGIIALLVGSVMACAAAVNASNGMLHLLERRSRMAAAVLVLGFSRGSVCMALLAEAALVAGAGALGGWLVAYSVFEGRPVSTFNMQSYETVAFDYVVGWPEAQVGLALAALSVLVGAVSVAVKLARTPLIRMLARG